MTRLLNRCMTGLVALGLLAGCTGGPRIDCSLPTPDQHSRVKYLVLHDTITDTPESIRIFTHWTGVEASIHYLLSNEPQPVISVNYFGVPAERWHEHAEFRARRRPAPIGAQREFAAAAARALCSFL
jgi:hypothetical protein